MVSKKSGILYIGRLRRDSTTGKGEYMYGYIEGFTETEDIRFCSRCGKKIDIHFQDGTGECPACGFRFGVIEFVEADEDFEKAI